MRRDVLPPLVAEVAPPARTLCTDCGISRSADPHRCGRACQFIKPDYAASEIRVHGRARDPLRPDELHFGPHLRMLRASLQASPPASASGCWKAAPSMPCSRWPATLATAGARCRCW
jgi:hypothetical protein